jgi:hypothetical protein
MRSAREIRGSFLQFQRLIGRILKQSEFQLVFEIIMIFTLATPEGII